MEDAKEMIAEKEKEETAQDEPRSREEEYLEGWKRAMADYANLKRDTERLREEFAKYAAASLIAELLPVFDNLQQAVAAKPSSSEAAAQWVEGVGHIASRFDKALRDAGVSRIEDSGARFDPTLHEAMLIESHEALESGTVVRVLETGYALHDKVLRPAKVVIAE